MSNELAVREDAALAPHYDAALAIQPGQTAFDEMQRAALRQLGLDDAPDGDLSAFLHVSQRTGLDPFSRQIYMIGRNEKVPGTRDQWRKKYTIQTGIDGLRVLRARAEHAAGVRGILSPPLFYDGEGNASKVWVKPGPPVACEITYTVRDANGDTPYTSVLRFTEYAQYKDGNLTAQWAVKHAHMLEKCTEADVYRKAFPQDFSGIHLTDAMPADGADTTAPAGRPERKRVTADTIRARTVTSAVITDSSPAASETSRSGPAATRPADTGAAGEDQAATVEQLKEISRQLEERGYAGDDQRDTRLRVVSLIARKDAGQLTQADARKVADTIEGLDAAGLAALLDDIALADDPRDDTDE